MTEKEIIDFIVKNDRLIWYIALRSGKSYLEDEVDDIAQELRLSLYVSLQRYDPSREASIHTYATICMKHYLHKLKKTRSRKKRIPAHNVSSLDTPTIDNGTWLDLIAGSDDVEETTTAAVIFEQIETLVSKRELEVLKLRSVGLSYRKIGEKIGLSYERIRGIESRALEEIRRRLGVSVPDSRR